MNIIFEWTVIFNFERVPVWPLSLRRLLISTLQLCGIYQSKEKDMSSPAQSDCLDLQNGLWAGHIWNTFECEMELNVFYKVFVVPLWRSYCIFLHWHLVKSDGCSIVFWWSSVGFCLPHSEAVVSALIAEPWMSISRIWTASWVCVNLLWHNSA